MFWFLGFFLFAFFERLLHLDIKALLSYYQQGCSAPCVLLHIQSPQALPAFLVDANVSSHTELLLPHSPHPFSVLPLRSVLLFVPVLSLVFLHLILFSSILFQVLFHPNPLF